MQQYKISQATARIAKVREGFEGGMYDLREAKARITQHQAAMAVAEEEIRRLQVEAASPIPGAGDLESLREFLRSLRDQKLNGATFEERLDPISKLDVKVYPSEDVQSMRVTCRLGLPTFPSDEPPYSLAGAEPHYTGESEPADGSGIVLLAPPYGIRTSRSYASVPLAFYNRLRASGT